MKHETEEILRLSLLMQLDASRVATGLQTLCMITKTQGGFKGLADADIERELEYLASKGFVAKEKPGIAPGAVRWRITAAGTDYIAENC